MPTSAHATLIARRYAQAAFELADDNRSLDQWRNDLHLLSEAWTETRLAARLDNPALGIVRRMQEVRDIFGSRISPLALNMVLLLVSRQRAALVPAIAGAFERLVRERERRVTARVTSAIPLTAEQRRNIQERLGRTTGSSIDIEEIVDPSILGGLIVRIGDELIDASVAGRLREIDMQISG